MVEIREALLEELPFFAKMEMAGDAVEFVIPYSFDKHSIEFNKENTIYLSIVDEEKLVGFIILALEPDGVSVEFRRIVVSEKGRGIGQLAITAMEDFCKVKLNCKCIWLDVFESNQRGRYIYEKFGYAQFKTGDYHGQTLLYYQKML